MTAEPRSAHYTVLARRFRPQTFGEVVGQQHVAQALQNAIQHGRVAHAYLFTGARGVGKTSMARILAKALNCPNVKDGNPCNECEICRGIAAGNDVDVLEIDGASNRGIDDIRSLRANVNVKSMRTRHKMYIIDEVHMLTKEAFNALLKTLEEPPPNVKFVFCTTEPNKVPDTILSRCQRFDFATIETTNIIARLQEIAEAEGYQVEPDALELVARRANGSMRDSQSLFDQLLAFGQERISTEDVHRLLGTASDERLMELADALIAGRRDAVLQQFDATLADGVQLGELVDQLIGYARDLMVLASGAESVGLMAVSVQNRARLKEQADRWGLRTVVAAMQILAEAKGQMFRATSGRALAELALVRICLLEDLESIDRLIQDLRQGRTPSPSTGTPARRPAAAPTPAAAGTNGSGEKKKLTAVAHPPAEPTAEPHIAAAHVKFVAGNERQLWSQILEQLPDALRVHAKGVRDIAISGPNGLELLFPKSYHLSRTYCERPEVRARLEQLASQTVGQPVRMTFDLLPEEAETTARAEPVEESPARLLAETPRDDFVSQALSVFGGNVVKVERIAAGGLREE